MKRKLFSSLFIAATLGLIVIIAFSNSDLTNAWEVLFTLKTEWLLCAFLGWFGYMFFDMLGLYYTPYAQAAVSGDPLPTRPM